jgi:plasmid stability protein
MANLQVKDIDDRLYILLREKARSENRSISQEVITILEDYLANPASYRPNPTREFLSLSGAWEDDRSAEKIISDIRKQRKSGKRFGRDNVLFD